MGRTLYIDASFGMSGDMAVAALLDLGADRELLQTALNSLPLEGYQVSVGRVKKSGLDACDFRVILDETNENHDHDMQYLYGHEGEDHGYERQKYEDREYERQKYEDRGYEGQEHEVNLYEEPEQEEHGHAVHEGEEYEGEVYERKVHEREVHDGEVHGINGYVPEQVQRYEYTQAHKHKHDHMHGHRGMKEIRQIIEAGSLTDEAKALAIRIFDILAEAEAKAHGVNKDEVHFHEVGAVDSIVDITAFAVCFDMLKFDSVILPRLCEGTGTVRCQHGILPVPVPAVVNIAGRYGLPMHIMNCRGEYVTPTGAAIAAAITTAYRLPETFQIQRIGMGAGKREQERPGLLRMMIIEEVSVNR